MSKNKKTHAAISNYFIHKSDSDGIGESSLFLDDPNDLLAVADFLNSIGIRYHLVMVDKSEGK